MTFISLPRVRPDYCRACPLFGRRPSDETPYRSKRNHICALHPAYYLSGHGSLHGKYRTCTDKEWADLHGKFPIAIPFARRYGIRIPGDEQLTLAL